MRAEPVQNAEGEGTSPLDRAFDGAEACIVLLDQQGRVLRLNRACTALTGWQEAELRGEYLWPHVMTEEEGRQACAQIGAGAPELETVWRTRRHQRHRLRWTISAVREAHAGGAGYVAVGRQVSDPDRPGAPPLEAYFFGLPDGVVLLDPAGTPHPWQIVDCNPAFARMNGYERHELIGQSIDVLHEEQSMAATGHEFLDWLRQYRTGARGWGTHRHRDGHVFMIESSSALVTVEGKEFILGVDREMLDDRERSRALQQANRRLLYQVFHDDLTGLLNRRGWERLPALPRPDAASSAIIVLDLDQFKPINDQYGHAAGDAVLRIVARRIQDTLRRGDAAARLGGDEFAVLLTDVTDGDTLALMERLQRSIEQPMELGEAVVAVQVSVGMCPVHPLESWEVLMRRADDAMYAVKRARHAPPER